jgi:hypothetical protein
MESTLELRLLQNVEETTQDQGVDGRMGSEWILGRLAGSVEWIWLARGRDRFKVL